MFPHSIDPIFNFLAIFNDVTLQTSITTYYYWAAQRNEWWRGLFKKKCAGKCAKAKEQSVVFMYLLDHVEKKKWDILENWHTTTSKRAWKSKTFSVSNSGDQNL